MASALRLKPGTLVGRDYKIVRMLAKGGMGAVYIAEQESTGVERALKVMHPQLLDDMKSRERFTQEAKIAARIESDHVVKVLGAGIDDALETPWIAMEYIKGEDLETYAKNRGPLPAEEVYEIFRQLCHGIGAAHRMGVVHRDLKLQNVLIAPAQRSDAPFSVKVLDFGISKISEESQQTDTTAAVGSPMWMAPEQAQKGKLAPATDVWPLGLIAFRLLTGKAYWKSGNVPNPPIREVLVELLLQPLETASVRARSLGGVVPSPAFDGWFAKAVVRDTAARFADANEALSALGPVLMPGVPNPLRGASMLTLSSAGSPVESRRMPEPEVLDLDTTARAGPPPGVRHENGILLTRQHDEEYDGEDDVATVMRPAPVIDMKSVPSVRAPSAPGGLAASLRAPGAMGAPPSAGGAGGSMAPSKAQPFVSSSSIPVARPTAATPAIVPEESHDDEIGFARTVFSPRPGGSPTTPPPSPSHQGAADDLSPATRDAPSSASATALAEPSASGPVSAVREPTAQLAAVKADAAPRDPKLVIAIAVVLLIALAAAAFILKRAG
ncbi:MAG: protein kinase [Myxococcales bacterium]|nr:protein kinase [Myxococcales bacterium]